MPAGLETYYNNGKLQLSLTDRLTKHVISGSAGIMEAGTLIKVNVPGIRNDGTWFAFATELTVTTIYNDYIIIERTDRYTSAPEPHNMEVFYSVIRQ